MPRILLIEDEVLLRHMMSLDLLAHHVELQTAADGQQAIAQLTHTTFDLLFLDLTMPHVDGFAVLAYAQLKRLPVPIIVLSNARSPLSDERCDELGAREIVTKVHIEDGDLWRLVMKYVPALAAVAA